MPWTILVNGAFKTLTPDIYRGAYHGAGGRPPAQFYLSGDAHRHPPFGWATTAGVAEYFDGRLAQGALCFHVEQLQRDVSARSIPQRFNAALAQNRVFGWELPFYGTLNVLMEEILEVLGHDPILPETILRLDREIGRVQGLSWNVDRPEFFRRAAAESMTYRNLLTPPLIDGRTQRQPNLCTVSFPPVTDRALRFAIDVTPRGHTTWLKPSDQIRYKKFLKDYFNDLMDLRCKVNHLIGNSISQSIGRHPNATHLIAIGGRHISENPVQAFIRIGNSIGLVDGAQD